MIVEVHTGARDSAGVTKFEGVTEVHLTTDYAEIVQPRGRATFAARVVRSVRVDGGPLPGSDG